jgi:mannose-1-phosphate guanylyltransferase
MQALVLVGGLGTRLRPLTFTRPKPLLPVLNEPLIDRILDDLPDLVDEAVIAGGYRMEDVEAHFEENPRDVEVTLVDEDERLGTAGAVKNAQEALDGPFFVLNGDVLCSLDLEAMRDVHEEKEADATIALWDVEKPQHFGVMDMVGDRIQAFVEKPPTKEEAPSTLANAGTYLLEPEVLDAIPEGEKVSIEKETFPQLLDEGADIFGFPFEGYWVDCGRPETYREAHATLLEQEGRDRELGDRARIQGTIRGWVSMGEGATVHGGATVARSVLLDGARVEPEATIRDSVLGEGATVEAGATVEEGVLGDDATVEAGDTVKGTTVAGPEGEGK